MVSRETFCMPQFILPLKSLVVPENAEGHLICTVTGSPEQTVTWYKNGQIFDNLSGCSEYEILVDNNIHSLHLYKCTEQDAGVYQVSARNNHGMASCSAVLEVGSLTRMKVFDGMKQKYNENKDCHESETGSRQEHETVNQLDGDIDKNMAHEETPIKSHVDYQSEVEEKATEQLNNCSQNNGHKHIAEGLCVSHTSFPSLEEDHMLDSTDTNVFKSNSHTIVTDTYQINENSDLAKAMTILRAPVAKGELAEICTGAQEEPFLPINSKNGYSISNESSLETKLILSVEDDQDILDELQCSDVMTEYTNALWQARLQGHELPLKESDRIDDVQAQMEGHIGSLKENTKQHQVSNYCKAMEPTIGFPGDESRLRKPPVQCYPSGDSWPSRYSEMLYTGTESQDGLPSVGMLEVASMAIKDQASKTQEGKKKNIILTEETCLQEKCEMTIERKMENVQPGLQILEVFGEGKEGREGPFSEEYCPGGTYSEEESCLYHLNSMDSNKRGEWDMTKAVCPCEFLDSAESTAALSGKATVKYNSQQNALLEQTDKKTEHNTNTSFCTFGGDQANTSECRRASGELQMPVTNNHLGITEDRTTHPCFDFKKAVDGSNKSEKYYFGKYFTKEHIHEGEKGTDDSDERLLSIIEAELIKEAPQKDNIVSAIKNNTIEGSPDQNRKFEHNEGKEYWALKDLADHLGSPEENVCLITLNEKDMTPETLMPLNSLFQPSSIFSKDCSLNRDHYSGSLMTDLQLQGIALLKTDKNSININPSAEVKRIVNEGKDISAKTNDEKVPHEYGVQYSDLMLDTKTLSLSGTMGFHETHTDNRDAYTKNDFLESNFSQFSSAHPPIVKKPSTSNKETQSNEQCQSLYVTSSQVTFEKDTAAPPLPRDFSHQSQIGSEEPSMCIKACDAVSEHNNVTQAVSNLSKELSNIIRLTNDKSTAIAEQKTSEDQLPKELRPLDERTIYNVKTQNLDISQVPATNKKLSEIAAQISITPEKTTYESLQISSPTHNVANSDNLDCLHDGNWHVRSSSSAAHSTILKAVLDKDNFVQSMVEKSNHNVKADHLNSTVESLAMSTTLPEWSVREVGYQATIDSPLKGTNDFAVKRLLLEKESIQPEKDTNASPAKKERTINKSQGRKKKKNSQIKDDAELSVKSHEDQVLPLMEIENSKVTTVKGKAAAFEAKNPILGKKNNEKLTILSSKNELFQPDSRQKLLPPKDFPFRERHKVTSLDNSMDYTPTQETQSDCIDLVDQHEEDIAKRMRLSEDEAIKSLSETKQQQSHLGVTECTGLQNNEGHHVTGGKTHKKPLNEPQKQKHNTKQEKKAPKVLQNIRAENVPENSSTINLWCQFGDIHTDCFITWIKDGCSLAEVKRR
ncbi:alpha-protein kinase 2 isoform X2 [Amia ocellicauda]|uniref:alpha-protein kinase 2 isoform X2 n=1 Tax=Amia ocellicauda TaxID=2972642 RepID=UPI003464BCE4